MSTCEKIRELRTYIPANVTLVCVSKFQPVEAIREAYDAGERHFGESRVQELKTKIPQLPQDIHWHFIGKLQTNKVRDLLRLRPCLIHSVDSIRLLQLINDEAAKLNIVQDVLLEVHVAKEETKSGFTPEELNRLQTTSDCFKLPHVRIRGLMAMATNTDDEAEIRRCFTTAKQLYDQMVIETTSNNSKPETTSFVHCTSSLGTSLHLSMGMSDDYRLAIESGATIVRIGSAIFGERSLIKQAETISNNQKQSETTSTSQIRAVFFDQDGVLYNSMPYHAESWAWAMTRHGLPYTALETYRNEGRTSTGVIEELHQRRYGTPASPELIATIYKDKTEHFTQLTGGFPGIIPDVDTVLDFLHDRGVQCWVVTGSGQRNLINALNDTFHNVFTGIISSFDVKHGKPDPEPYLKAWERSGFRKDECIVVENAPLGVRAAKAAGLFTCAVNTGILPDSDLAAEHADCIFHSMKELLAWLRTQL